jgi:hypothetical protein
MTLGLNSNKKGALMEGTLLQFALQLQGLF